MNKNVAIVILVICVLVSLFFNGYLLYQHTHLDSPEPTYLHDTIVVDSILILYKTKVDYVTKDSIQFVYRNDTITDTCYVYLPIEHKTYKDLFKDDNLTLNYAIEYSGYNSTINKVEMDYEFSYKPPKPKKFHLSLQAGIGTMYDVVHRDVAVGPYFGIGGSYDLW